MPKGRLHDETTIIPENARPSSFGPLPSLDASHDPNKTGTILLFYQYVEPEWSKSEHKSALKKVIQIASDNNITGRGRVAREGLNCTLTGKPLDVRRFCNELRSWNSIFQETDFKLTDGLTLEKCFKSLSIRKTDELVAYGLGGKEKAPSLKKFSGIHLEADAYHEAMQDPEAVIIDVRNAYETAIGKFQPPQGGAKLIDPKMRNSIEFPKWLASKETQDLLNNKKVLMYCTGGIRCERATALLNQMSAVDSDLKPKGVYHCRGGIERYVKTFPEGGFWKGKNYLFDKRMEQIPGVAESEVVEKSVHSKCCLCRQKWTVYRGQHKCGVAACGVPVIVCKSCTKTALLKPDDLRCELCREGYRAPSSLPDLVGMKRKAMAEERSDKKVKQVRTFFKDRLFLKRLPLATSFQAVVDALGKDVVKNIHWLVDRDTCAFYGSCVVLTKGEESKSKIIQRSLKPGGIKMDNKKIKIAEVFVKEKDLCLFDGNFIQLQRPPIGNV